jgi:hypothetical protein
MTIRSRASLADAAVSIGSSDKDAVCISDAGLMPAHANFVWQFDRRAFVDACRGLALAHTLMAGRLQDWLCCVPVTRLCCSTFGWMSVLT